MIEPIMFIGIGFLVAGLLVIGVIPLVHARAVRLTMQAARSRDPDVDGRDPGRQGPVARRIRDVDAPARDERRADEGQDHQPARRDRQEERGRSAGSSSSSAKRPRALFALEAKEKQLTEDLRKTEEELAARTAALQETEQSLADTQAELGELTGNLNDATRRADSQRVELIALRAQVEVLKGQIETYEKRRSQDLTERLSRQDRRGRGNPAASSPRSAAAPSGSATASASSSASSSPRPPRPRFSSAASQELHHALDEQGRLLARARIRRRPAAHRGGGRAKTEADLRAELADAESRRRTTDDALRDEKAMLEEQLRQAQEERAKLQREIEQMKRDADATWAAERMENAVMRERINDVAAEVARLTSVLEGPGNRRSKRSSPASRPRAMRPPMARSTATARQWRGAATATRQGLARRPHPRAAEPRLAGAAAEPGVGVQPADVDRFATADVACTRRRACRKSCASGRALSSAGERSLHTGEVVGSIPTAPTIFVGLFGLSQNKPDTSQHKSTRRDV